MSENAQKPRIRFKGFSDAWEQRKLGNIAAKVTEKNTQNSIKETFTNSAEMGVVSQRDFFDHDIAKADKIDGYYIVQENDFIYNPRISVTAPCGPINRNKLGRKGVMSPLYTIFRTNGINPLFLEWYFKSSCWYAYMYFNGDSGARSDRFSIKNELFFDMPIPLPKDDEQWRIGLLLESLNNLITLHQRKYDKLVAVKKSLLEKMFPADGETVPKIRFKGFSDAWEQRKLGELSSLITKGTTPLDKNNSGIVNFVKIESIDESSGDITITQRISIDEHNGYLRRSQLKENDILFSIAGTLGRVTSVKSSILPANTNQALAIIRLKDGCLDYVKTYLKGKAVAEFIKKNPTIGAQPNLSLEQVANLEIAIPSVSEQVKIGNYFEKLDNLITLHQRQLEKLKNIKSALLEKMFV